VGLLSAYIAPDATDTDPLTEYEYDNSRRLSSATLAGSIGLTVTRDPGTDPAHPERKGRLRSISSPNSGNGTAAFQVDYTYADEDPGCVAPALCPPGQLKTLTRGDIKTTLSWDGFVQTAETHTISGGSTRDWSTVSMPSP
jgi:hypothetical protein